MVERYYTDIERAAGPFTAAELARLVTAGSLKPESQLVREGDTEWRTAAALVPALFGAGARRARLRRWALGAAAGVALAAAVAALVVWAPWSSGGLVDDRLLRQLLPSDVTLMSSSPRLNDFEAGESIPQLDTAVMAGFCGSGNVGNLLVRSHGKSLEKLAEDGVLDLFTGERTAQALECGRATAAGADGGLLLIEAGQDDRTIVLWKGSEANLIGGVSHNFSGLTGLCTPEEGSTDCAEQRLAVAGREHWWAWGLASNVAGFARDWAREDRTETTNMEIVRQLASEMEPGVESRILVKPDALAVLLATACVRSAPGYGLLGCLPAGLEGSIERIQSRTRGFGWQHRPFLSGESLVFTYYFAARDEADAEDIANELEAVARDWKAHLENQEGRVIERLREEGGTDADFDEARLRAFARAVHEAEPHAEGTIVRWALATDLLESEAAAAQARRERLRARYEAVARIVDALAASTKPNRSDLTAALGAAAADWILMPRASEAQCGQITAHVAELVAGGVPTEQFGARFRQSERFSAAQCPGMLLPEGLLECVLAAPDFVAMEACKGRGGVGSP